MTLNYLICEDAFCCIFNYKFCKTDCGFVAFAETKISIIPEQNSGLFDFKGMHY